MVVHEMNWAHWNPSLYLDEHGEADPKVERGLPLYLDTKRVEELTRLYLEDGIADYVSRNMHMDGDTWTP